ncbi:hypothetical protein BN1723_016525, partial [Verticillium longisporum]
MASDDPVKEQLPQQLDLARLQDGPYVLRTLLEDVPLSADGPATDVKINCVEYFDHNLYVGTSASELLHFVQIPPDPSDPSGRPTFILASRLQPPFAETNNTKPGVQQILLLPRVSKACILCNWTVTFYSLPELSPVFGTTQVKNCNWVGGVDLNDPQDDPDADDPVTILLSLNRRIQDGDDKPPLPARALLAWSLVDPGPLDASGIPLPDGFDLEGRGGQEFGLEKATHLFTPRVEAGDDPDAGIGRVGEEVTDGGEERVMQPGHPQAIGHEETIKCARRGHGE